MKLKLDKNTVVAAVSLTRYKQEYLDKMGARLDIKPNKDLQRHYDLGVTMFEDVMEMVTDYLVLKEVVKTFVETLEKAYIVNDGKLDGIMSDRQTKVFNEQFAILKGIKSFYEKHQV